MIQVPAYLKHFEKVLFDFVDKNTKEFDPNTQITSSIYVYMAQLNHLFLTGHFSNNEGLLEELKEWLDLNAPFLDQNRKQVFHYKIACLHFGADDYRNCIKHLNLIIHSEFTEKYLKQDVQCFARILSLVAHFELGNMDLLEYQLKSTYRFLIKYGDLQQVQEEVIGFIRKSVTMDPDGIEKDFIELKFALEDILKDPFERRPLLYLDLIGWLTAKIERGKVENVIRERQNTL